MNGSRGTRGGETTGQKARASTLRKEVNHLKRVLAEKTLELIFSEVALQKVDGSTPAEQQVWREASTSNSGK